jgi:transcriptional regulator with XRE-family HTH domain
MKERIIEFLKAENKSSAQLAEEIGVQPSGISHILSGRNNPSLDFVMKMLDRYKYLSTEWLLFGRGAMYKENQMQSLFEGDISQGEIKKENSNKPSDSGNELDFQSIGHLKQNTKTGSAIKDEESKVVKIVWFYSDKSFHEYYPGS